MATAGLPTLTHGGRGWGQVGRRDHRQRGVEIPAPPQAPSGEPLKSHHVLHFSPGLRSRGYGRHMRDKDVVAAIVAGNPDGLAAAYDRYAAQLYSYCRTLLREPADAADAVQDTFVIAASRLSALRDPARLRAWLYAVVRNECLRRLRGREAPLDEALEMTDESAEVSTDAEQEELRALVRAGLHGLNPTEQEVLELQLRQGLDVGEVADVLDVSRNHAHALLSRARDQLETALGVLLVARTGRQDCPALAGLLREWDGQLTVLLRKRVNRHIDHCPVCTDRRRRELAPAMFLGITPIVSLPLAAAALPSGLRAEVLRLALGSSPDAVAHRTALARHAMDFGHHGFPKALPVHHPRWWHATPAHSAAAGSVAAGGIAIAVMVGIGGGHRVPFGNFFGGSSSPSQTQTATQPAGGSPDSAMPTPSGFPGPSPTIRSPHPRPSATKPRPPRRSTPPPTSPPPSTNPPPTTTPPPTTAPGTLSISPTTVVLSPLLGQKLRLTAVGGPVHWKILEPASLLGSMAVTPSSGEIAADTSKIVTLTVSGLASLDTQLTASPGNIKITVVLGVGLLP